MGEVYLVHGFDEIFIGTVEQLQIFVGPERSKAMGTGEREIIIQSIAGMVVNVMEELLFEDEADAPIILEIR